MNNKTIINRALFADYIRGNNIASADVVSKFHRMLDGTATEFQILSDELWTMMMNQYRQHLIYNL
ncbi:MAG: hypothetical protein [Bacteriophage sp.]|nr:MAG: hypothetical protein [Bacteriophage sp.]